MNRKRWRVLLLPVLALALLCACGKGGEKSGDVSSSEPGNTSSPEEPAVSVIAPADEEPVYPYANPLTGEGVDEDISGNRPIAVMFNNLKKALPQVGVSQADVLYEIVAEGGITRIMGVYQDLEGVGDLGSIRSARDYYVNLAVGHDAVYIHAGGSPQAYDAFDRWGVTHIDFVNGPYGEMCWRDPERRKNAGLEHSMFTSSEKVLEQMPTRFRLEHKAGYEAGWRFDKEPPAGGQPAGKVTVPFSTYKTGFFSYDAGSGQYHIQQHIDGADIPYVDGQTGQPVGVSNVLVLYTDISMVKGDEAGRMDVRTTGTGDGLLLRDGQIYQITWKRDRRTDNLSFLDKAGKEIPLAIGPSYINIVKASAEVVWE